MTRWVNLQHVHITSHFQHTRTSWIILAQVFKPWSHRTLKNIVVEVSMVVCRWWWCIEPWLVQKTPDAAWFVSIVHGWWNACITHIYIFYRYMSHTDTHTYIYIYTLWIYTVQCECTLGYEVKPFKTCVYPQLPCPMTVVMDDHFMIFPVGNFDNWTILIKVVVHILYKWGIPNPHEPQKHQACFASNHKTLIFTETGNQSQRSPAATNLVFDFPPAATNLVVRSFRVFFCYLALFLLGKNLYDKKWWPLRKKNHGTRCIIRLAKVIHSKTKKREPDLIFFWRGCYTPEN